MDYLNNVFGLILGLGILALIVVLLLYLFQKKKVNRSVSPAMIETDAEVIERVDELVEPNSDSLKAYLSPLRNDQPAFIHHITNLLERFKTGSDVKVLMSVLAQLEVKSEVTRRVAEYGEHLHILNRQKENFKQKDELQDLVHERDKRRILNEIENLADEAGGIEKARKRELDNLEAELTHEYAMKAVRNKLADVADREKNVMKTAQLNDMNDVYRIQHEAIKNDKTLTPAVRKETLRTIEQTFIAQLDEFKRGL